jgi:hypothetical protein
VTYTVNWQTLNKFDDHQSFVSWLVVNALSEHTVDGDAHPEFDNLVNRVGEATDGFTNVTITIQLGGVEVNADHLIRRMHDAMRRHAQAAAVDEVRRLASVDELTNLVASIQRTLNSRAREILFNMGAVVDEDGDLL